MQTNSNMQLKQKWMELLDRISYNQHSNSKYGGGYKKDMDGGSSHKSYGGSNQGKRDHFKAHDSQFKVHGSQPAFYPSNSGGSYYNKSNSSHNQNNYQGQSYIPSQNQ